MPRLSGPVVALAGLAAAAVSHLVPSVRTQQSSPPLDFVLGRPTVGSTGRARPVLEQPPATFAGASASDSAFTFGAAAAGVAIAARVASLVACRARRQRTWYIKQRQNAAYLKRNPPPLLTKRELRKRVTKVKLMRRDDVWSTEFFCFVDPREDRYQWSVSATKQMLENPDYKPDEKVREAAGIPMPPIRMMDKALQEMRGERMQMSGRTATKDKDKEDTSTQTQTSKRQAQERVDLSSVDQDFLSWKGIQLSKKQKAQFAAKGQGKKK